MCNHRHRATLAAALAAASFPGVGRAAAADSVPTVIMVMPAALESLVPMALAAARAQLSDLSVRLQVERPVGSPPVLAAQIRASREIALQTKAVAAFGFDLTPDDRLSFYLVDPKGVGALVREVAGADDQQRFDTAAIILRASLAALLRGGSIGVQMPACPPANENDRAGSDGRLRFTAAYAVAGYSSAAVVRHGLAVEAAWRIASGGWLFFGYRDASAVAIDSRQAFLRLETYAVDAGARWLWPVGKAQLGLSMPMSFELESRTGGAAFAEPAKPVHRLLVAAGLGVHAAYPLFGNMVAQADLGARFPINPVEFAVETPAGLSPVLSPWPVQPRLTLGIAADIL